MRPERIAGSIALLVFAALLVVQGGPTLQSCSTFRPVSAGEVAPDFSLPVIAQDGLGPRVSLADLRGSVVLVDFWATWCKPCRTTMPKLEALAERYDNVKLVSINTEGGDSIKRAHKLATKLAPHAISLLDTSGVANRYRVTTIPHLVLIDASGRVVAVERGSSKSGLAEVARRVAKLSAGR